MPLKSSAKTFGAMQLSVIAEKLEAACTENHSDQQNALVTELPILVADTKALITTVLADWWQPEAQEQN